MSGALRYSMSLSPPQLKSFSNSADVMRVGEHRTLAEWLESMLIMYTMRNRRSSQT
jgi:hypothetical protein